MIEQLEKLKGKKCNLKLKIGDSYSGVLKKIEININTTELRIVFVIEEKKELIIRISAIESIDEIQS